MRTRSKGDEAAGCTKSFRDNTRVLIGIIEGTEAFVDEFVATYTILIIEHAMRNQFSH